MSKRRPPGEPPPERPFGQEWSRDREPSDRKKVAKSKLNAPTQSRAALMYRYVWRRIILPFLIWVKYLIRRSCDELLVFSLKTFCLIAIITVLSGSFLALQNYSLRQLVDIVIVNVSKHHGIETGSISSEHTKPPVAEIEPIPVPVPNESTPKDQPRRIVEKRRPKPQKERPFFDRLIDRIDEALGWKKS
jgi:hypothetical protein